MYPPQSPTRITNNSILKLPGASHCVKTSRMRFWAFSYSMGEPWGRSFQVIMYFDDMCVLLSVRWEPHPRETIVSATGIGDLWNPLRSAAARITPAFRPGSFDRAAPQRRPLGTSAG